MTTGPNKTPRRTAKAVVLFAGVLTLATLAACGSGDGGGGGGTQQAGIEGTGIVSGFGSVYIDGVEFATDDATILFVGDEVPEARLSAGDHVNVTGKLDAEGRAHAQRIVFQRTLDGPIDRIETDGETGTLVALGQTVRFDGDTTFVNTPAGQLSAGDLIAVSGFAQPSNRIQAESIRQSEVGFVPNDSVLEIHGAIDTLEPTRLTVGDQTIDFSNAQINPGRAALSVGARIDAFGTRGPQASEALIASRIEVRPLSEAPEGSRMLVEAPIRTYADLSDFVAGQWRIDATDAKRLDDIVANLAQGVRVSVRGVFENGRVKAQTLRVEPASNTMLQGAIESIDRQAGTLTLLGRTIHLPADTRYVDRSETSDRALRIDTLSPGDIVRIRFYMGDKTAIARRLERLSQSAGNNVVASVALTRVDLDAKGATLVAAGVTARIGSGTTRYYDVDANEIDEDTFYQLLGVGTRVQLTGPQNGGQISLVREARILRDPND